MHLLIDRLGAGEAGARRRARVWESGRPVRRVRRILERGTRQIAIAESGTPSIDEVEEVPGNSPSRLDDAPDCGLVVLHPQTRNGSVRLADSRYAVGRVSDGF